MKLEFMTDTGCLELNIVKTIEAGWTGRDRLSVNHHIEELKDLGIAPPSSVPLFYRTSSQLLTQDDNIEVVGDNTSGEAEPLIIITRKETYLGLASDHTDRTLEVASVAASKQACPKPVAKQLWRMADIEGPLDNLEIRSSIYENETWVLYQQGASAGIRPLDKLVKAAAINADTLGAGEAIAMLCGTCPVISGGIRPAGEFRMSLVNPASGEKIFHQYHSITLPIVQ